jgi:ATP synthase protein I
MSDPTDSLKNRIAEAQAKQEAKTAAPERGSQNGIQMAWRISIELVAGILVGGWLGWMGDDFFNTKPWLFLIGLCFGIAGAGLTIYRTAIYQPPQTEE